MKTKFIFILYLVFFLLTAKTGDSQTYFQKAYLSSPYNQEGQDVVAMPDGGYLIAGYTTTGILYDCDVYVIKTDAAGNIVWTKTYGGNKPDFPNHMIKTTDGNYFLIGFSQSYGGGDKDFLLLKIDPAGNVIWQKTYGGFGNDEGKDIIETADGNYLMVGSSNFPPANDQNARLIKIDPAGTVLWDKFYGGPAHDYGTSVNQCADGGYIMLGQTYSYGAGNGDAYLIRTNGGGDTLWTKTFGGTQGDEGIYVTANNDDSYTFLVRDSSNAGKDIDIRITKANSSGGVIWSKSYGGNLKDTPKMIQPTMDGGYIAAAISRSFGWVNPDMWIMKFNNSGDTLWTKHFGGNSHEHCYAVKEQPNGDLIAVGKTDSYAPNMDVMFLKLNMFGTMVEIVGVEENPVSLNSFNLYPNPSQGSFNIDLYGFKASQISITNILGEEVYRKELRGDQKSLNITLNDRSPGVYFLKSMSDTRSITNKFIIN